MDTSCTDRQCDAELLALCQKIDKEHDTLKLTEKGCEEALSLLEQLNSEVSLGACIGLVAYLEVE